MIKNYLKIAFRNLRKNLGSSFINIFGLSIGLTSCLLIGVYIRHELSYDNFQVNGNRIARVIMEYKFDGGAEMKKGNFTSVRVGPVFTRTFPEVVSAVRMDKASLVVQYKDKMINEKSFMFADSTFFKLFSFKLLQGNPGDVLNGPRKVVLTETTAKRYFADEDPIGKMLKIGTNGALYQVTGVMADCPSNSQIKFDFLASFSSLGLPIAEMENTYWDANYTTFLLLKDKTAFASLQPKITPFMQKEMKGQGASVDFLLEPFTRIHLHSEYDGFEPNNSIRYIYILEAIAALILLIACFTYVNLHTARSMERAKEVGVRKVMGAGQNQLFWQFIGESAILCTLSIIISLLLAMLLLPSFNQITEKQLVIRSFFSLPFLGGLLLVTLLVSLGAGSYPALILSGFQPVKVLKGAFKNTGSGQWVRKSLIVFQFSISVFLIVSTFIMQRQLTFIQHKDLGYKRDRVLVLPMDWKMIPDIQLIKNEWQTNSHIQSVSVCANSPVNILGGYNMRSSVMPETQQIAVSGDPVDQDFVRTTGLTIIAGSDLTDQDMRDAANPHDSLKVFHYILNESAARQLGWTPEKAIGQKMFMGGDRPGYVKAVVRDFNFESLHHVIKPLVLFSSVGGGRLLLKLKGDDLPGTISFIGSKWKTLVPYRPFEYRFLDDDFNKLYNTELRLGTVLDIFAAIAIALACLGLLGLSAYAARQRVKEIGIRKVLGAGVDRIVFALTADFIKLVVIAIVLATPLVWWLMEGWLDGFAYRIQMNAWIFIIAGLSVVAIALITVSFQTIRAALANPIKSLRTE